jgi:hypothetical protein
MTSEWPCSDVTKSIAELCKPSSRHVARIQGFSMVENIDPEHFVKRQTVGRFRTPGTLRGRWIFEEG